MKLTVRRYLQMGPMRDAFDQWLRDEGLVDEYIFEATFGEGHLIAGCFELGEDNRIVAANGEPVRVVRRFRLATPPPPFVFDFCEAS